MLPRAFPGIIVVFASLLHNNAYAQRRELGPTEWRTFEVREFGTSVQFPASIFAPAEEKRAWDAVVTRISLSLRPLAG
jgi:hypothetical protein